jgi:hypothetical protein
VREVARYRRFDVTGSGSDTMPSPQLEDVRLRRAGLKAALSGLELALCAPAPNRVEWVLGVRESLHTVHEVWTRHIVETEAPGAFLDELVSEAPRLSTPATKLRREHSEILAAIVRAEHRLEQPPDEGDDYETWSDELRTDLTSLLVALARHRQRGADLVYQAYDVDIGGGF